MDYCCKENQMIGNLFKKIACSAVGALLALNAGCLKPLAPKEYTIDTENFKARPFAKLYGDLSFSSPVKEVSNVPESFRNVPIHSDDFDWGQGDAIKDDSAKVVPLIDYKFLKGGLETKIGNIGLDLYANLSFNISYLMPFSHDGWGGEVNERNYQGGGLGTDNRGYGTALTYWTANYAPILIPGFNTDLSFPIAENVDMIIGGGIRNYKLQAERGWDRYNALDKKDCLKIADITEKSIYLGFRMSDDTDRFSPTFKIGYNFYDYDVEEKEVVIDGKDKSLFVSLGAEIMF